MRRVGPLSAPGRAAVMAALAGLALLAVAPGVHAGFTTAVALNQRVAAGSVVLQAESQYCPSPRDGAVRRPSGSGGGTAPCDDGGGSHEDASPLRAPDGTTPGTSSRGFTSEVAVAVGGLRPSGPASVPIVVTNRGTLRVASLHLSVMAAPMTKADAVLPVAVLYNGKVVAAPEDLATLAATGVQLLTGGAVMAPNEGASVRLVLSTSRDGDGPGPGGEPFALTITLAGSDA